MILEVFPSINGFVILRYPGGTERQTSSMSGVRRGLSWATGSKLASVRTWGSPKRSSSITAGHSMCHPEIPTPLWFPLPQQEQRASCGGCSEDPAQPRAAPGQRTSHPGALGALTDRDAGKQGEDAMPAAHSAPHPQPSSCVCCGSSHLLLPQNWAWRSHPTAAAWCKSRQEPIAVTVTLKEQCGSHTLPKVWILAVISS